MSKTETDWRELADLAVRRIRGAGAEYGDIRLLESVSEIVRGQDRRIAGVQDSQDSGFGVRVLYRGAWGFAASSVISPEELPSVVDLALEIAKGSASLMREPVLLAPEPVQTDSVVTPFRVDPFAVPLEEKTSLLLETMELLHRQSGIERSSARLWARRDRKFFASTEEARIQFDLLAVHGECEAT
ncbi:MAG: TldD/PmbA family protein, partial [Nitrospirae bacterium]